MYQIKTTLTARVKGEPDWIELSPNGEWVALNFQGNWQLFDAFTGTETRSLSLDSRWAVVSNSGRHIAAAVGDRLVVVGDDGVRARYFSRPNEPEWIAPDLLFSADGNQLWATIHDEQGQGRMALLDVAGLEVLDSVPMPIDSSNIYSTDLTTWLEPQMALHASSGTVAITHSGGDSYLGTFFFRQNHNRIQQLPDYISWDNGVDYLRPLLYPCFSYNGTLFASYDAGILNVWQLPQLRLIGDGCTELVDYDEAEGAAGLTFIGESPTILVERSGQAPEIRIVGFDEKKCSLLARGSVTPPVKEGKGISMIRGTTLVGVANGETLVQRVDQAPVTD